MLCCIKVLTHGYYNILTRLIRERGRKRKRGRRKRETETETQRETDKETDRERDRDIERQRQIDRQGDNFITQASIGIVGNDLVLQPAQKYSHMISTDLTGKGERERMTVTILQ